MAVRSTLTSVEKKKERACQRSRDESLFTFVLLFQLQNTFFIVLDWKSFKCLQLEDSYQT